MWLLCTFRTWLLPCFLRRVPERKPEAWREGIFYKAWGTVPGERASVRKILFGCACLAACAAFLLRFSAAGRILWVLSAVLTAARRCDGAARMDGVAGEILWKTS